MDWPTKLDVLIEYSEEDKREKHSTLLGAKEHYGFVYGPMAMYQTDDGEKFWIDGEYYTECKSSKKLPVIPFEVIRKNEQIQVKLAEGREQLEQDNRRRNSNLIIPPDVKV